MKTNLKLLLQLAALFLWLIPVIGLPQTMRSDQEYLVVSFEIDRTKDAHDTKKYYWIISKDSLGSLNATLSPLFLTGFTNDQFQSCCNGNEVDIYSFKKGDTFDLSDQYLITLNGIIEKNKRKIQTVTKNWNNGYKERIDIYVTPVKGQFCMCPMSQKSEEMIGFNGCIFLPKGNFVYDDSFWESAKAKSPILNDLYKVNIRTSPF